MSIDPRRSLKSLILIYFTFGCYFFYKKFYRKENLFFADNNQKDFLDDDYSVEGCNNEIPSNLGNTTKPVNPDETFKETLSRHTLSMEEFLNPMKLQKKKKELKEYDKELMKQRRILIKEEIASNRRIAKEELHESVKNMANKTLYYIKNPRVLWEEMKQENLRLEQERLELEQYEDDEPSFFGAFMGAMRQSRNSSENRSSSEAPDEYDSEDEYNWICWGCWTTVISSRTPVDIPIPSELSGRHIHYFSKSLIVGPIKWRCTNCGAELFLRADMYPRGPELGGCTHVDRPNEIMHSVSSSNINHRWVRIG